MNVFMCQLRPTNLILCYISEANASFVSFSRCAQNWIYETRKNVCAIFCLGCILGYRLHVSDIHDVIPERARRFLS